MGVCAASSVFSFFSSSPEVLGCSCGADGAATRSIRSRPTAMRSTPFRRCVGPLHQPRFGCSTRTSRSSCVNHHHRWEPSPSTLSLPRFRRPWRRLRVVERGWCSVRTSAGTIRSRNSMSNVVTMIHRGRSLGWSPAILSRTVRSSQGSRPVPSSWCWSWRR